jgi:hypothetical protein
LQSQNPSRQKKRLPLNGLEVLHGRRKWVIDSLDAILRVLLHEIAYPKPGAGLFIETVADDFKPLVRWISAFFKSTDTHKQHHLSDATSQLSILGMNELEAGRSDIAEECAETLRQIATNLAGQINAYDLADVHVNLEALAQASDAIGSTALASRVRAMITLPAQFTKEVEAHHLNARETRQRQFDGALASAGRRSYNTRTDPVERLYVFKRRHPAKL